MSEAEKWNNLTKVYIKFTCVFNGQFYSKQKYNRCDIFLLFVFYIKFEEQQKMQMKLTQLSHSNQLGSAKILQKATSLPSFTDTTNSSSNSIDSTDDEYRKLAFKWILSYNKKVTKDTQYLAIAYLIKLGPKAIYITEDNYEMIAITTLLIASKMNEIYPPKISSMIARCKKCITKDEIIEMECKIVTVFNYEIALQSTPYTLIAKILGCLYGDKLQQCQKLLRIVALNREIYQYGDEILAYAIIYLIIPQFVREMKLRESQKIKTLAIKIYNLYQETKQRYEKEKENQCFN